MRVHVCVCFDLFVTNLSLYSCNGNLLLNVAPTHDGRITPIFEERLLQIGSLESFSAYSNYVQ